MQKFVCLLTPPRMTHTGTLFNLDIFICVFSFFLYLSSVVFFFFPPAWGVRKMIASFSTYHPVCVVVDFSLRPLVRKSLYTACKKWNVTNIFLEGLGFCFLLRLWSLGGWPEQEVGSGVEGHQLVMTYIDCWDIPQHILESFLSLPYSRSSTRNISPHKFIQHLCIDIVVALS